MDLLYHTLPAPSEDPARQLTYGPATECPYALQIDRYLERDADDDSAVLLMLGDYGMCAPADRARIDQAAASVRSRKTELCLLSWFPYCESVNAAGLHRLPRQVKLAAAVWSKRTLARFAKTGARWPLGLELEMLAEAQAGRLDACRLPTPPPEQDRSTYLDQYTDADKAGWALPYHNLYAGRTPNPVHRPFVEREGLIGMMPAYETHAGAAPSVPDIPLAGDIVEAIAKRIGADRLAKLWEQWTGQPCGCAERKAKLNRATERLLTWWSRKSV